MFIRLLCGRPLCRHPEQLSVTGLLLPDGVLVTLLRERREDASMRHASGVHGSSTREICTSNLVGTLSALGRLLKHVYTLVHRPTQHDRRCVVDSPIKFLRASPWRTGASLQHQTITGPRRRTLRCQGNDEGKGEQDQKQ